MQSKSLVTAIALALAAAATMAVYLYVRGVQTSAQGTPDEVSVLVAKEDIPIGTSLDDLIDRGAFTSVTVPENTLVAGAVTDLSELAGKEAAAAILAGEQIPLARVEGQLPGGSLGIPDGHEAISLSLAAPRTAGGAIRTGDNVTIYGTFQRARGAGGDPVTVTLVEDVQVLATATTVDAAAPEGSDDIAITLALKPEDAQRVVFAQEQGSLWLGLLPPGQRSERQPPTTLLEVTR